MFWEPQRVCSCNRFYWFAKFERGGCVTPHGWCIKCQSLAKVFCQRDFSDRALFARNVVTLFTSCFNTPDHCEKKN